MMPGLLHFGRRFIHGDAGQALPLFAVLMTAFFGVGALVVDVGHLFSEREDVENAVDAGALAGAQSLPSNAAQGQTVALQYVLTNAPSLTAADVSISFRCLVGDRNHDGLPDASDIPAACDPKSDASWIVAGGLAVSPCVPAHGDKCNVIFVAASTTVGFSLAPVLGPAADYTCSKAAADAATAKAAGVAIVTVGFGLAASDMCPDTTGAYHNVSVLQLLADMATASTNGGCNDAENTDGDDFFCLPKTSQLSGIFQSAAATIAAAPRLLTLPH